VRFRSAIVKTPQSIALSVGMPQSNPAAYEQAVGWTGLVNGWYNIVTFLTAFALVGLLKFGPKYVHAFCLLLAAS
jgi:maltose/moltooligosaccharide transporter